MYMKRIFSLAVIALLTANMAMAQWGGPVFESPVVHDDNTVTFSYLAPDADSVKLSGQFMDGLADLTKNEEGLWSVTVGPIEPDMYPYNFIVNGVSVADPKNSLKFPNEGFQASIVEVTGGEP
ncbi:MAG TPA: esterase, partial [Balneolaceae bacterium]|nr:esterase [Balneolaceae bacterium]